MIFPVSPQTQKSLEEAMAQWGVLESDLEETFIRGSGSGGQKINKTSVVVVLTHVPSRTVIRCQQTRSQAMNRYWARRQLLNLLEAQALGKASREEQAREKIRRQKRKRSKRAKIKMLDNKRHHGTKKANRQKVAAFE